MISGALLIPKEESYKKLFTKRIFRMIIILLVFSFVGGLINKTITISSPKGYILTFLKSLLIKPIDPGHYWYLYAYIALLFSLPIIRKMCSSMNKKDYYYYFICWIIFSSLIATVKIFVKFSLYKDLIPEIFSLNLGFFIIGHFLTNIIDLKINKNIFISIIATIFICVFVNVFYTVNDPVFPAKLASYSTITITILAICIFYLTIYYVPKIKMPPMLGKVLSDVGSATFGIYLLHMIIIYYTQRINTFLSNHMNKSIAVIPYDLVIFIIGYIITKILQKIPYIKKII